ncbi:ROK family protein [Ferrimonas lipolytica]|uniref:ROK family protein n=1 Tax=Ferrimonas lipolytica TaxID=2724191 RepID=A0A6H1UBJ9_9GAMM|nr:ROK family protein [Ferrimonas lipolytica]QIZ75743.1 ROK family protein [Ferrimonas lipolytica]
MRIGIDLGGTKIELIALDRAGVERFRLRRATPQGSYPDTVATIAAMVLQCEQQLGCQATIGIGIPGVLSRQTGKVKNANSQCLNGQDLLTDVAQATGRPVRVANDANCFAVSEASDGAAANQQVVFAAIIGTGCGAGIVIDGKPLNGANGLCGEWGHNPMPWLGAKEHPLPQCFCGRYGCIEQFVSGSGYQRLYQRLSGAAVSAEQIERLATQGDKLALQAQAQLLHYLADALAHVVNLLDPDCIVLGGGLSNLDWLYPALNQQLPLRVLGRECVTPVVKNKHGDSSGVRGAAWLWEAQ